MIVEVEPRAGSDEARPGSERTPPRHLAALLVAWGVVLVAVNQWGTLLNDRTPMKLFAPPLFGRFDLGVSWRVVAPILVAAAVVGACHRAVRDLSWRALLGTAAAAALAWGVSLAIVDGTSALAEPLLRPMDYLANLPLPAGVGDLLQNYARNLGDYSLHAQGHPPGPLLFLWALDGIGLRGAEPAAAVILIAAAATVPAVLLTIKELAGEDLARRAAPFLVLTPAAVWIATSMDALFMAIGAWGIAFMTLSATRHGVRSDFYALTSGAVLGIGLFMSYGVVALGLIVLAVTIGLRRIRPLLLAAASVFAVVGIFASAGFWWVEGLGATMERYELGVAGVRPYSYFAVANLAALSLAAGPAVLAAFARLEDGRLWLLCGAALAGVAVANLSGLSKGEVERIWLPFVPWLTVATASIRAPDARLMLAAQTGVALAIQLGVRTPW